MSADITISREELRGLFEQAALAGMVMIGANPKRAHCIENAQKIGRRMMLDMAATDLMRGWSKPSGTEQAVGEKGPQQ